MMAAYRQTHSTSHQTASKTVQVSHQQCFGHLFKEREIIACRIVLTYLTCTTGTSLHFTTVRCETVDVE